MAISLTRFAEHLTSEQRQETQIWNLGGAGSVLHTRNLGQFHWIHQVRDLGSGREEFPSPLSVWGDFPEAPLITCDRPMFQDSPERGQVRGNDLVDMEGFGFYQAAIEFFPHSNIRLGKWVTDYLSFCDPKESLRYSEQCSESIYPLLQNWTRETPSASPASLLKDRALALRYTKAMVQEVIAHEKFFKNNFPQKSCPELPPIEEVKYKRKLQHQHWKRQFEL